MADEITGATSSESGEGGLSAVEAAAFNDTTPIPETFEDGELDDDTSDDDTSSEDGDTSEGGSAEHEEDDDSDDDIEPASFDDLEAANKHIAKLNRENASRRVQSKKYDSVFGQFDEDVQDGLLGLVSTLATDPEAGAKQLLQVAKNILGEDALKEPEFDPDKPMTFKEYEALKAKEQAKQKEAETQRQQEEENEKAVKAIFTKAEELGYKDKSTDRHVLLSIAAAETNGNLDKAHEKVQAYRQSIIDEYLNGKSKQADDFPVTGEGAQPGNNGNTPKNWNDFIDQSIDYAKGQSNVGN